MAQTNKAHKPQSALAAAKLPAPRETTETALVTNTPVFQHRQQTTAPAAPTWRHGTCAAVPAAANTQRPSPP